MNLATVPPAPSIVSCTIEWNSAIASRVDSASTRSPNEVEPTRSAKSTVTTLRVGDDASTAVAMSTGVPHWSQKRAAALTPAPQDVHVVAVGVAHSAQNLAPCRFV